MVLRPEKELKAFKKIMILPAKTAAISVNIDVKDLAYFDSKLSKWTIEPGQYQLMAASSSKDIRQTVGFNIK